MGQRTDGVPAGPIDEVPTSWMQLADPEFDGKVAMWDDGFGHIVVMAKTLGFPEPNRLTGDQLDQVVDALTKIRNNSRVVAPSPLCAESSILSRPTKPS